MKCKYCNFVSENKKSLSNHKRHHYEGFKEKVSNSMKGKNLGRRIWDKKEHPRGSLGKHWELTIEQRFKNKSKGEAHYKYTTGISFYRRRIFNINQKICTKCGSDYNIIVHHKDLNRNNNNLDNLMIICRSCHMKLHRDIYINRRLNNAMQIF